MAQRYEREIAEILERLDRQEGSGRLGNSLRRWGRRKRQSLRQDVSQVTARWSPGRLIAVGIVLVFGALIFARVLGPATPWVVVAGLAALILGYVAALSHTVAGGASTGHTQGAFARRSWSFKSLHRSWRAFWRARRIQ